MSREILLEFPETIPLPTASRGKGGFKGFFRMRDALYLRGGRQFERNPPSRVAGDPADCRLVQQKPSFRFPHRDRWNPAQNRLDLGHRAFDFDQSAVVAGIVRVPMDKHEVVFGVDRQKRPNLSAYCRHRVGFGRPYRRPGNCCADGFACTAMDQQTLEVFDERPVRASFANEDKSDGLSRHEAAAGDAG